MWGGIRGGKERVKICQMHRTEEGEKGRELGKERKAEKW